MTKSFKSAKDIIVARSSDGMGKLRDFFKRMGILGSAASAVSSTGEKLLDLKNKFMKIGKEEEKKRKR